MRQVKFSIRSWFGNWVLVRLYNFHICVANGSFFCSSSVFSSAVPSLQSENTDSRSNPPRVTLSGSFRSSLSWANGGRGEERRGNRDQREAPLRCLLSLRLSLALVSASGRAGLCVRAALLSLWVLARSPLVTQTQRSQRPGGIARIRLQQRGRPGSWAFQDGVSLSLSRGEESSSAGELERRYAVVVSLSLSGGQTGPWAKRELRISRRQRQSTEPTLRVVARGSEFLSCLDL